MIDGEAMASGGLCSAIVLLLLRDEDDEQVSGLGPKLGRTRKGREGIRIGLPAQFGLNPLFL
jgi:hypothetical protein